MANLTKHQGLPRGGGGMSLGFGGKTVNPPLTQTGSFITLLYLFMARTSF